MTGHLAHRTTTRSRAAIRSGQTFSPSAWTRFWRDVTSNANRTIGDTLLHRK